MKFKSLGFILTIAAVLTASQVSSSAIVIGSKIVARYRQAIAQENPSSGESFSDRLTVAGLNETEFKPFLVKLQQAIAKDDAIALSKLISYPISLRDRQGK